MTNFILGILALLIASFLVIILIAWFITQDQLDK